MKRGYLVLLGILVVVILIISGCGGAVIVYSEGDMRCMSNNAQLYTNNQWSNVQDCSAINRVCETIIGEDLSVNENTAGISGATRVVGVIRRALSFDGVDDIGSASDSASLDISEQVTVEAWIKPDVSSRRTILAKCSNYWLETESDGRIRWGIRSINGNLYILTSKSGDYSIGNWYHFVGVYDGQYMKAYVNGAEKFSRLDIVDPISGDTQSHYNQQLIGTQLMPNNKDLTIAFIPDGCYSGLLAEKFYGTIEEVAVYNRALSEDEILTHYNNYQIGSRPNLEDLNLVAYYGLEDSAICAGANNPPIASAVSPVSGFVGDIITLDGSGSSDLDINDVLSYSWGVVSLPEGVSVNELQVSGINSLSPSFVATVAGTYIFKLTVSDGITSASSDAVVDVIRDPGYLRGGLDSTGWTDGLIGVGNGKGLILDGWDDYVDIPYTIFGGDVSELTIGFWVKPITLDSSADSLIRKGTYGQGFMSYTITGAIYWIYDSFSKNQNYGTRTANSVLARDSWQFITLVFKGGDSWKVYKNRVLVNSKPTTMATLPTSAAINMVVGGGIGGSLGSFNGVIDEVSIWNIAVDDAASVAQVYDDYLNLGKRPDLSNPNLLAYYGFDEGSGDVVSSLKIG